MKKKLFSIIMCVLMVMCFMPSMAFADPVDYGTVNVMLKDGSTVELYDGEGLVNNDATVKATITDDNYVAKYSGGKLYLKGYMLSYTVNSNRSYVMGISKYDWKGDLNIVVESDSTISLTDTSTNNNDIYLIYGMNVNIEGTGKLTINATKNTANGSVNGIYAIYSAAISSPIDINVERNIKDKKAFAGIYMYDGNLDISKASGKITVKNSAGNAYGIFSLKTGANVTIGNNVTFDVAGGTGANTKSIAFNEKTGIITRNGISTVADVAQGVTSGYTLTIPSGMTLKIQSGETLGVGGTGKIIVEDGGKLIVDGNLDMSQATPADGNYALEVKNGGEFEVNGTVTSGKTGFADLLQLGTLTINTGAKYKMPYPTGEGTTTVITYIGEGGAVTLGADSRVVSVPNDKTDYTKGYIYTLTGTATANDFAILGNDSFVIPSNSEFKVNKLTLSGEKKNQLIVENGGKLSKAVEEPTFSIESGKTWEVTSGTFYFDPTTYVKDGYITKKNSDSEYVVIAKKNLVTGTYMADPRGSLAGSRYWAVDNNNGTWTVYYSAPSNSSTTTTELEKAKTEAKAEVKAQAEASKYDETEAAEVKAIKDQADKDITAAKTVDEVNKIKAEAEAKIDAVNTAGENAEIKLISGVDSQVFKAWSKKSTLHGKKAIKVSWKLPEGVSVDGYEVYRSTSRYSGYGTEPYFTTTNATYKNNKNLKSGKTYYYKIRGYKMINGEKIYTGWSTKAYRTIK